MAKLDREPAQAQTHGGSFQDHRGGAEAKEGTPAHASNRPLLNHHVVILSFLMSE